MPASTAGSTSTCPPNRNSPHYIMEAVELIHLCKFVEFKVLPGNDGLNILSLERLDYIRRQIKGDLEHVGVDSSSTCRLGCIVATHPSRIRESRVRSLVWPFVSLPTEHTDAGGWIDFGFQIVFSENSDIDRVGRYQTVQNWTTGAASPRKNKMLRGRNG